jgi:hypothetical protein
MLSGDQWAREGVGKSWMYMKFGVMDDSDLAKEAIILKRKVRESHMLH